MINDLDMKLIIYTILVCYIFDNHPKSRLLPLAPMADKEKNETTDTAMEDITHFNSKTCKAYFNTITKDIYEIDLIIWGKASIADDKFKKSEVVKYTSCRILQSQI